MMLPGSDEMTGRAFENIRPEDIIQYRGWDEDGMSSITLRAPAKINLYLDISGRDRRGYHVLNMVNRTISLADTVEVQASRRQGPISFRCDNAKLPTDGTNTCVRAAELFRGCMEIEDSIDINLTKRIPSEAGLGGGSADGAAVLLALNRIYGEKCSEEMLQTLSLAIGTDVPFCRLKRTALCTGDGSKVRFVRDRIPWESVKLVLIKPDAGISTRESYGLFDRITGGSDGGAPGCGTVLDALETGDIGALAGGIYNSLAIPARQLCPAVADIEKYLMDAGALFARMTGSGTCVYGFFDRASSVDAQELLAGAVSRFGRQTFTYAEE